jgi:nitric oxide reductase NorD protein
MLASVVPSAGVSSVDHFDRYNLLASAIAGRIVEVAPADPGTRAWTDGTTIFIAGDSDARDVLCSIAVQASLLGASSLTPAIVTKLERRSALAARYLAIEGHRALAVHDDLLPPLARSLLDPAIASLGASPADTLRHAESRAPVADAPAVFGTIRPRALRSNPSRPEGANEAPVSFRESRATRAADDAFSDGDLEGGPAFEVSSAWVGRGGALGRLLKKLFADARVGGTGPAGSDATARWSRRSTRASAHSALSTALARNLEGFELGASRINTYPEWDVGRGRYRPDWCTVAEVELDAKEGDARRFEASRALRRPLARVGLGLERRHRQLQGDDIDLDAAVEAFAARVAGSVPDEACYVDSVPLARGVGAARHLGIGGRAEPKRYDRARAAVRDGRLADVRASRSR